LPNIPRVLEISRTTTRSGLNVDKYLIENELWRRELNAKLNAIFIHSHRRRPCLGHLKIPSLLSKGMN